jgi:hypothetical protein
VYDRIVGDRKLLAANAKSDGLLPIIITVHEVE